MQTERVAVGLVVAVIAITAVSFGPLVGVADLTESDSFDTTEIGTGNATIGAITFPQNVTIEQGEFGSESYYLRVPPAVVELSDVSGRPILSYTINVPELGFSRSNVHFVSSANEGEFEATLPEETFDPDRIIEESYDGALELVFRSNGDAETVGTANVTVEVAR